MRPRTFIPALLLAAVTSGGCATIVSKSSYPIRINSEPSHSHITVTDRKGREIYSGGSPANLKLKPSAGYFKAAEYTILIEKPGYATHKLRLSATINGWYFGNLLFGGLLGFLVIDPISGAMFKMKDLDVNEILLPLSSGSTAELKILDINTLPDSMKEKLVRIN